MRSADEVTRVNALHRTYVVALAAAGTLRIVDGRKVVYYLYRALGTGLFTLSAGDTAVKTYLSYLRALVVAITLHDNLSGIVHKVDDSVGAGLYAQTASDASTGVDLGNTLLLIDADGISGADLHKIGRAHV